jgi:hypothetical protein
MNASRGHGVLGSENQLYYSQQKQQAECQHDMHVSSQSSCGDEAKNPFLDVYTCNRLHLQNPELGLFSTSIGKKSKPVLCLGGDITSSLKEAC